MEEKQLTLQEKLEFINKAFIEAKLINTFDIQYEGLVNNFYDHISEKGLTTKEEFLEFYSRIINSELGYTEEDKEEYEVNVTNDPMSMQGKLNSYQAYLFYQKMLENETEEDEDGTIIFVERPFDLDEYKKFYSEDLERLKAQFIE